MYVPWLTSSWSPSGFAAEWKMSTFLSWPSLAGDAPWPFLPPIQLFVNISTYFQIWFSIFQFWFDCHWQSDTDSVGMNRSKWWVGWAYPSTRGMSPHVTHTHATLFKLPFDIVFYIFHGRGTSHFTLNFTSQPWEREGVQVQLFLSAFISGVTRLWLFAHLHQQQRQQPLQHFISKFRTF